VRQFWREIAGAIEGKPRMNGISENIRPGRGAAETGSAKMGLGPNQLIWLRRNITAFRDAEQLWLQMKQDSMQSARIAGLL
jgi:hypothetical protein